MQSVVVRHAAEASAPASRGAESALASRPPPSTPPPAEPDELEPHAAMCAVGPRMRRTLAEGMSAKSFTVWRLSAVAPRNRRESRNGRLLFAERRDEAITNPPAEVRRIIELSVLIRALLRLDRRG
jgi:hypothetical protein